MIPAYEREPTRTEIHVHVLETAADEQGDYVILDDTILYPTGGGQPCDHGELSGVAIRDVRRHAGELRHYIAAPVAIGPVTLTLDWARRFDHMQQHTAQHLLSALAADVLGWPTTSFHLGTERSDIELDVADTPAARLVELEDLVAGHVRAAHPIASRRVDADDRAAVEARSRGLPEGHEGQVRLVQIEAVDVCACGGTHLENTAQIEALKLLGVERMRGGTRLYWVAGARVRRLLARHEERAAALRRLLGAADDDVPEVIEGKLQRLRQLERQTRSLQEALADGAVERLLGTDKPVMEAHWPAADAAFLQRVGRELAPRAGARLALLTAGEGSGPFLLAQGPQAPSDLAELGPRVALLLEGRGGGRGHLFQGRAGSLARRAEALALLRSAGG